MIIFFGWITPFQKGKQGPWQWAMGWKADSPPALDYSFGCF